MHGKADIRCPRCGRRAEFDEPFEFLTEVQAAGADPASIHRWGGWRVRAKYPSVFAWVPPRGEPALWTGPDQPSDPGGYRLHHHGVVRCPSCHLMAKHRLAWPDDAYFRWQLRGETLWAQHADDARLLLHYIESTTRQPDRYPGGMMKTLRKLPASFLKGRNRDLVAGRIRRSLQEAGLTPDADLAR